MTGEKFPGSDLRIDDLDERHGTTRMSNGGERAGRKSEPKTLLSGLGACQALSAYVQAATGRNAMPA